VGQGKGTFEMRSRLALAPQIDEEGRRRGVPVGAGREQRQAGIHSIKSRRCPLRMTDRHGSGEGRHRRDIDRDDLVVGRRDPPPVRLRRASSDGVKRGNLGAQVPHGEFVARGGSLKMIEAEPDQAGIPLLARLIFQELGRTIGIDPRRQARRGERQQGRKGVTCRPAGHGMHRQGTRQTNRLDAKLGLNQHFTRRRRVALAEHEIERGAHRLGALRQLVGRRWLDRNLGRRELAACPHQPLRNRRRLGQQA